MAIPDLPTPAVVVDLDRLEANLRSWQAAVTSAGPRFRPHIKTHKTVEIAAQQIELGASGIASAKVSEAEVFAAAGIRDIVIAYPVIGADKAERVARMAAGGTDVAVNVDSELGAEELSTAAVRHGARIGVQLEIDTGLNRVGFRPDETDRLESLARFVMSLPGLQLEGITTHRGVGLEGATAKTPAEAGVQVKTPSEVMNAPAGGCGSSVKLNVCAGASASVATAVKAKVWPRKSVRLPMGASTGAVLSPASRLASRSNSA